MLVRHGIAAGGEARATTRAIRRLAVPHVSAPAGSRRHARTRCLAGAPSELFRLPMRGYFSADSGSTWGGVDLPLPAPNGNGLNFGSDPSLAFDSSGNLFYSYIVVYFGNGNGINATAMAVAHSTD